MKWTNGIIIGLVISLLLVVLILLITILCGFDTKIITDWISSLSTAGTLLVAYMAYKKAPQWIKEKNKHSGYNYASKLIDDTRIVIEELKTLSPTAQSLLKPGSDTYLFERILVIERTALKIEFLSDRLKDCTLYDTRPKNNEISDNYSKLMLYCKDLLSYYTNKILDKDPKQEIGEDFKNLDEIRNVFRKRIDDIFLFD
ncbi:hypothetical protein ACIQ2O_13355 [Serratia grimesii]|uniref:hypothetical protein n=1 Tax=Serratia grimesii TaxID=82995 RepID=UPI00383A9BDD